MNPRLRSFFKATVLVAFIAAFIALLIWHERRIPLDVAMIRAAHKGFSPVGATRIPRQIWTYWEGRSDELVEQCWQRCRRMNPDYSLVVLNATNVRDHIPELPVDLLDHPAFNDFPARKADLVRCFAVAYRGGIWMDASIVCMRPFAEWVDHDAEFVGFFLKGFTVLPQYPVVENWFFASRPGCRFMEEWCWEFARLAEFLSASRYVTSLADAGVALQNISGREYLAMHCAAQRVMQQLVNPGTLRLQAAEEGPYKFLVAPGVEWDSARALSYCIDHWDELRRDVPFLKLRGPERHALAKLDPERRRLFVKMIRQQ
jgi:hypothetical protein